MYHLDEITSANAQSTIRFTHGNRDSRFWLDINLGVMFRFRTFFQLDHPRYSFQILNNFIFNLIVYTQKSYTI
jgi:hypothetical protein